MKKGYSIIEVLLAGVIFSLAASGVSAAIMFAQRSSQASTQQTESMRLAEEAVSALDIIRTRDFDELVVQDDMGLEIDGQGNWVLNLTPGPEDDFHDGKLRRINIDEIDGIKTADITVTFEIRGASSSEGQVTLQETFVDLGASVVTGVTSQSQNYRLSDQAIDRYAVELSPINNVLGEVGRFSALSANPGDEWYTVDFNRAYGDPIVIGTANTEDSSNPANVFEVRNVTPTSAEMRLCNSRGVSGVCDPHNTDQTGAYLILDLDKVGDVSGVDAGKISLSGGGNGGWSVTTYGEVFSSSPRVFSTIQQVPGNSPLDTKVQNVNSTNFQLLLCHMDSDDNCASSYTSTEIGWVAFSQTSTDVDVQQLVNIGLEGGISDSSWDDITFGTNFASGINPVVLVENQTNNGVENGEINSARNITPAGAQVRYCELDSGGTGGVGTCHTHSGEDIAWISLAPGLLTFTP